jgi:hypothetical protein
VRHSHAQRFQLLGGIACKMVLKFLMRARTQHVDDLGAVDQQGVSYLIDRVWPGLGWVIVHLDRNPTGLTVRRHDLQPKDLPVSDLFA